MGPILYARLGPRHARMFREVLALPGLTASKCESVEMKRHERTARRLGLTTEAYHESCIVETDRSSI